MFIGLGWTFWGAINLPLDIVTIDATSYTISASQSNFISSTTTLNFNSSIVCFVVSFFCIIGYPLLACCGACGLTVLPISLIL